MSKHRSPLAVARAFTEAWTSHDMATAASYLAEDVVFTGPINHSTSAAAYIVGLTAFAQHVTAMRLIAAQVVQVIRLAADFPSGFPRPILQLAFTGCVSRCP